MELKELTAMAEALELRVLEECERQWDSGPPERVDACSGAPLRFVPFVELFEVPLRDGLRDLLRDVEARCGLAADTLARGADDELRRWSERDIPLGLDGRAQADTNHVRTEVKHAARRLHAAAAQIFLGRVGSLAPCPAPDAPAGLSGSRGRSRR